MRPSPSPRRRRTVLAAVVAAVVAALALVGCAGAPDTPATGGAGSAGPTAPARSLAGTKPNIVFVLTDDQTVESVAHMPYLQQQKAKGAYVDFSNAEVNNSICCPSRSATLSGQVDTRNGVEDNAMGRDLDPNSTFAVTLKGAGYHTGLFGKLLNGYKQSWGAFPGWDDFQPVIKGVYAQYGYTMWENGTTVAYGKAPQDYAVDVLTRKAVDFIRATPAQQPLMLYLTPTATHLPWVPAPRYEKALAAVPTPRTPNQDEADVRDKPAWVQERPMLDLEQQQFQRKKQWRAALGVDDMLRTLDETLAATGRLDDTVVVFMSDNGLAFGSHRWARKRCEYRECTAVPLYVRYPGQAGRTDARLVSNIDLASTFADLAGTRMSTQQDGVSLVPALEDPTGRAPTRDAILEHWPGGNDNSTTATDDGPTPGFYALRTAQYRYVEVTNLAAPGRTEYELYDEVNDPYELTNLAADPAQADLRSRLAVQLHDLELRSGASPAAPQGSWRPGQSTSPSGPDLG